MATKDKFDDSPKTNPSKIYLSIDHLKSGIYNLNITLKDKVIKTIQITK